VLNTAGGGEERRGVEFGGVGVDWICVVFINKPNFCLCSFFLFFFFSFVPQIITFCPLHGSLLVSEPVALLCYFKVIPTNDKTTCLASENETQVREMPLSRHPVHDI
jgi:hypothetical protein